MESLDETALKTKLLPLFDDLLLERLTQKESGTIEALSRYLAQIISRSAAHDPATLERSLQSVISPAIAREIADNKEKMIDALYPIIGGMISRYVTQAIKEMMEKINEKIEQGLSTEHYKRKIKAKLTGVSESELLLEESGDATIESIFIIQKETGLLIAEAHLQNSEIDDPHMVASMASAIKDFINDWAERGRETSEVQLLSYGNATLYIESAGSVYLIAFLDSEPDHDLRARINEFFARLIRKRGDFLQSFDGNTGVPQIKEIEEMIRAFLGLQRSGVKRKGEGGSNPLKIILVILATVLLAGAGYLIKKRYDLYSMEKVLFSKTGEEVRLVESDGKLHIEGRLPTYAHYVDIAEYVKAHTTEPVVNNLDLAPTTYYRMIQEDRQRFATLEALQKTVEILKRNLSDTQTELSALRQSTGMYEKKLSSLRRITSVRKMAIERLFEIFRKNPGFQKSDGSLDMRNVCLFDAGECIVRPENMENMERDIQAYILALLKDPEIRPYIKAFVIEGYTDSSGDEKVNRQISRHRADVIRRHILSLPFAKKVELEKMLFAEGMASQNPILVHGLEDKKASRRIKIRFILDNEKILSSLAENLRE